MKQNFVRSALWGAAWVFSLPAAMAGEQVVYFKSLGMGGTEPYLIEWKQNAGKARVVSDMGENEATVLTDGSLRIVQYKNPIVTVWTYSYLDSCGDYVDGQEVRQQLLVNDVAGAAGKGQSELTVQGELTYLTGCDAGKKEAFSYALGSYNRLAMDKRPAITDLTPGARLAGPSPAMGSVVDQTLVTDVVQFGSTGQWWFENSGETLPASLSPDQWFVLTLNDGQRGYTRLAVDKKTGAETWLTADWTDGLPRKIIVRMMVKPVEGAGFGSDKQAARMWQAGLFSQSDTPFYIYLYKDHTGERVSKYSDGSEARSPISWALDGNTIYQFRQRGPQSLTRTWQPLRSTDGKNVFVLENETITDEWGTYPYISRVNFYTDTGKAVPLPPSLAKPAAPRQPSGVARQAAHQATHQAAQPLR